MFKISKNLSCHIADQLTQKIIRLEISPGARILEQNVAKKLGVSRSPVREAFRILEKTGLVRFVPRCGVKVTSLSEKQVETFCGVLILLFSHAVRRCIERCDKAHRYALIATQARMATCADNKDNQGFYSALLDFISVGIDSTNNPVLHQMVMSIMPNIQRLQYIAIILKIGNLKGRCAYFEVIIEALFEKNPEKGVKATEAYIMDEKDYVLNLVKNSHLSYFLNDDD